MLNEFIVTSSVSNFQIHLSNFAIPGYNIEHEITPYRYGKGMLVKGNTIQYDDLSLNIPIDNENILAVLELNRLCGNHFDQSGKQNVTEFDLSVRGKAGDKWVIVDFEECVISSLSGLEFGSESANNTISLNIKYTRYNIKVED